MTTNAAPWAPIARWHATTNINANILEGFGGRERGESDVPAFKFDKRGMVTIYVNAASS
jgi:hypothetical protein